MVGYQLMTRQCDICSKPWKADRERYRDLQKVYVLHPGNSGNEKLEQALWEEKESS